MLDMQDRGLILIGLNSSIKPNSFCPLCEESYMDFTDIPSDFTAEDKQSNLE